MDAADLENRLHETIGAEELRRFLHVKGKGFEPFLRHHEELAGKLEDGSLTLGEFVDEVLWNSGYDSQSMANILNRAGIVYESSLMIAKAARYAKRREHVNGNRELDASIFSGLKVLPVELVRDMKRRYGNQMDRTYGLLYAITAYVQKKQP